MTSRDPRSNVLRLIYVLIALIAISAAAIVALGHAQSAYREDLLRRSTLLHLQVLKDTATLQETLLDFNTTLGSLSGTEEIASVLDRAVYAVTTYIEQMSSLHNRFRFPEADAALIRLQHEAELLDGLAWQLSGGRRIDAATIRERTESVRIGLGQLASLHESTNDELKTELAGIQEQGTQALSVVIALSIVSCGFLVIAIIRRIRSVLIQQAEIEREVQEGGHRRQQILDSMAAVVCVLSREGVLLDVNRVPLIAADLQRKDVVGQPFCESYWVAYSPVVQAEVRDALSRAASGEAVRQEIRVRVSETRFLVVDATCGPLYDSQGDIDGLIISGVDITARNEAEAQVRTQSCAIGQTGDSVMITSADGVIEYVNPAFERTSGYSGPDVIGRKPNILKSGVHPDDFYRLLWDTILAGNTFSDVFTNRQKNGDLFSEEVTITPVHDSHGRITHFVSTGRDVTERVQTQERLHFLASHDSLTGLPNRTLFLDRLGRAMTRARWSRRLVAALVVDVDHFKHINDSLGHPIGDDLLRVLATRLTSALRDGDTVARFGGDEFVVLLDDLASSADIRIVTQKLLESLRPPVEVGGTVLHVTASIGVSTFPSDGQEADTLLKHAHIAMYRAKDAGRNTCQFYSREMSTHALQRMSIENSLRQAVDRREFVLYYQPIWHVPSRHILGVEALLRWRHPDLGLVPPNDFIPILEETGLIVPVSEWAINSACGQAALWRSGLVPRLRLAMNVSSRHFGEPGLAVQVAEALARYGLPPQMLELEITETVLLRPSEATHRAFKALDELGVRFCLDDFGTGYSSLSYLQRFPFDLLKVDRSFIRDVPNDRADAALVLTVLAMAKSLRLDLIAEGVETEAQRDFLLANGCETMQGFLFGRPLPVEDVTALLAGPPGQTIPKQAANY